MPKRGFLSNHGLTSSMAPRMMSKKAPPKSSTPISCRAPPMSENRRIARAAGLIGALTLCSRIAGLARDAVVGYLFGTGPAADAFFVAFRAPNLLRRWFRPQGRRARTARQSPKQTLRTACGP